MTDLDCLPRNLRREVDEAPGYYAKQLAAIRNGQPVHPSTLGALRRRRLVHGRQLTSLGLIVLHETEARTIVEGQG